MAAAITLADGRCMCGSNNGASGMYWLIGTEIGSGSLRTWLLDMSERPGGFLDFDIRGLSRINQDEFWSAAHIASDKLTALHGPEYRAREHAHGANCLARLLEMRNREVAGEPPLSMSNYEVVLEWDGKAIDLLDLWFDVEKLQNHGEKGRQG